MTDDPVDLDTQRSLEGKMEISLRRQSLKDFDTGQKILRRQQKELKAQLCAAPAFSWQEAAIKAEYLIRRYAKTADALDARQQKLIRRVLGDFSRLLELEASHS